LNANLQGTKEMISLSLTLIKALARIVFFVISALYRFLVDIHYNYISHNLKKGIIGPSDRPPPPRAMHIGLWDYRGIARPVDIQPMSSEFPVGKYIDPRSWVSTREIGLSKEVVNQHTIVVGPTRSGKTSSIVVPWIYNALKLGYSVVAVDVKGNRDLLSKLKDFSSESGSIGAKAYSWDYNDPANSLSWNWIAGLTKESEINAAVEAICGRPSASDPNKFFHQSAIKYLRGLLQILSGLRYQSTLRDLIRIVSDQSDLERLVLANPSEPGAQRLKELVGLSTNDYTKYTMELKTHLELLDTDGFSRVTSKPQFSFDLLDQQSPVLLVVSAPISDGSLAEASSSLFLSLYLQWVLSRFNSLNKPSLLVLDEAARIQNRLDLGSTLSLVAGANLSVLMATQDLMQFKSERREEILSNCGSLICLPRVSRATTQFLSNRLGEAKVATLSRSSSNDPRLVQSVSWTQGSEERPVLGHREISSPPLHLGKYPAILHSPFLSTRPILVDLNRSSMVP